MKTPSKTIIIKLALVIIYLAMVSAYTGLFRITYSDFKLKDQLGREYDVAFPYSGNTKGNGVYTLNGIMNRSTYSPTSFKIIPDDQILSMIVNGKNVSFKHIPSLSMRDWMNGFELDLTDYLKTGDNTIKIVYRDSGGLMGVVMKPAESENGNIGFYLLYGILGLFLLYHFLKRQKLSFGFTSIIFVGVVIRFIYLWKTGHNTRAHDTFAHLEYIQYFVDNWSLPTVSQATDGAFFHPPLYFFICSLVSRVVQFVFGSNMPLVYFALQLVSFVASVGFITYGVKTVKSFFEHYSPLNKDGRFQSGGNGIAYLTSLAVVLWPSGILHSCRIGNDSFLYFFFAMGIFYLQQWYFERDKKSFYGVIIAGALAISIKANGAIIIAILFCLLAINFFRGVKNIFPLSVKQLILPAVIILIALGGVFYPGIILKIQGKRTHLYISNINRVAQQLQVGNTAINYLWFDAKIFITEPYTSPWKDELGRQYFWNYLGKTGLFGEWSYGDGFVWNMSAIISFFFLVMCLLMLAGLYYITWNDFWALAPAIFTAGLLIGAVTYMRMTFPVNIDFRYILPIIISWPIFFNNSLLRFKANGMIRLYRIGIAVELILLVSFVLFIFAI